MIKAKELYLDKKFNVFFILTSFIFFKVLLNSFEITLTFIGLFFRNCPFLIT